MSARFRRWVDASTTGIVTLAGGMTIALVVLLLGYLVSVVVPLAGSNQFDETTGFELSVIDPVLIGSGTTDVVHLLERRGLLHFFGVDGDPIGALELSETPIDQVLRASADGVVALTTSSRTTASTPANDRYRQLLLQRIAYPSIGNGKLERLPGVETLLETVVEIADHTLVDVSYNEEEIIVALLERAEGGTPSQRAQSTLTVARWTGDAFYGFEPAPVRRLDLPGYFDKVTIDARGSRIFLMAPVAGVFAAVRLQRAGLALLTSTNMGSATDATLLLGAQSLLTTRGRRVAQHFIGPRGALVEARTFEFEHPVVRFLPSPADKAFVAQDETGVLHWVHTTTEHRAASDRPFELDSIMAFGAAGDRLLLGSRGGLQAIAIDNQHAQVSLSSLFQRVWYEGYDAPTFTWQSSSADAAFEPKFSVIPLVFGTLKAAFYAMLFAGPIGIAAAIYSAYFMPRTARRWIKPGIELMAALPTVVLGFLAATLLAPTIETNLAAVVIFLVTVPLLGLAIGWSRYRFAAPDEGRIVANLWLLAIPLIGGYSVLLFAMDNAIESALFAGDAARWVAEVTGLGYDQRNALVVGIAMAFAVVPVIYSIAEDAIHDVPRSLVNGSLALGASTAQTLVRVVLTTASPGIASALIIGFGRAVGETMVVLMATGNTPILDWSAFNGLRSLAANLAIELPESEVASTHYRILFLTALVLFGMTFAFNTAAEVIRTRLRRSYGS